MEQGYNLKRVHKLSLLAIYGISIIYILQNLLMGEKKSNGFYAVAVIVLASIVYAIPMKNIIKGYFLGLVPTVVAVALMILNGFSITNNFILVIAIAIIALYFEAKLLLAYGLTLNILLIIAFAIEPLSVIGGSGTLSNFISFLIMINGAELLLFFLNRWGKQNLIDAINSELEVEKVMESLSHTMLQVEDGTQVLGENTAIMAENASATLESSKQVATAMQEITVGVQEQAESVADINLQVEAISEDVSEAHNISADLTSSNDMMMSEVTSGEEQIARMKSQMHIIDDAIEAAIVTVKDLEASMGDIQSFLGVITNISSQTNLLALNASIESARAGEAGKGFAVVADEIRKLAEQSAESVQDINNIVDEIGKKTQDAVRTVGKGNEAVDEGSEIIDHITTQYGTIKVSFEKNNGELNREMQMINQINEAFVIVNERISNIASISQEQSASSEEILATIENQDNNISNLTGSLTDIEKLSASLTELIEEKKVDNDVSSATFN